MAKIIASCVRAKQLAKLKQKEKFEIKHQLKYKL